MKKLRLKALALGAREILSREQLRSINGAGGCDDDPTVCVGYPCVNGFCETGSGWPGEIPGSGGGELQTCNDQDLGPCPIPGAPASYHLYQPMIWNNAIHQCIVNTGGNTYCA